MKIKVLFFLITLLFTIPASSHAWNYPRGGRFKQLVPQNDPWLFVDQERWDIKDPDKW